MYSYEEELISKIMKMLELCITTILSNSRVHIVYINITLNQFFPKKLNFLQVLLSNERNTMIYLHILWSLLYYIQTFTV